MFNILCVGLCKTSVCYIVLKTVKMSLSDNELDKKMNLEFYEDV